MSDIEFMTWSQSWVEFLRSPVKYLKARRNAKRLLRKAIRQLVASEVLRRIHIMQRLG